MTFFYLGPYYIVLNYLYFKKKDMRVNFALVVQNMLFFCHFLTKFEVKSLFVRTNWSPAPLNYVLSQGENCWELRGNLLN
jgi:hypothetical protein